MLIILFLAIAAVVAVAGFGLLSGNKKIETATFKSSVIEGETFVIPGKNFPVKPEKLQVLFNGFKSTLVGTTSDTLRVLVPKINITTDSIPARLALLVEKDTVFAVNNIIVRKKKPIPLVSTGTTFSSKPDSPAVKSKEDSIPAEAGPSTSPSTLPPKTVTSIETPGPIGKKRNGNPTKSGKLTVRQPNPGNSKPENSPVNYNPPPDLDLTKFVTVKSNVIANQKRKGTKDLQITIQNSSAYDLDNVNVEVSYKKKNGKLLHKEVLTFTKVRAHTSQTLAAPDDEESKKVDFKIVDINSKQINTY
ncbi:hypothetical protein [Adhaeribacter radiodurans]|uniref:Uncharacterized protein n=1 Tax=Adhaeribacter radiodurans TaxID=2745197 RepID=A0A7L7L932_9BACT|nr:hypothetical protein [Adhaeribacter radiodurans]QMU29331.1 hypothetical protein HUW48_15385 [Adhaeribacter radiodurans]